MPDYSVVRQRLPRIDALNKVTGAAVYSSDVYLPGLLQGAILRSPYPHAEILRLNTAAASRLEGVKALITAADVPGYKTKNTLLMGELPHLAARKAVYAGQPIAAVAAVNLEIARQALDLIEVEYRELAAVPDIEEALKPETPAVHPDLFTNVIAGGAPQRADKASNVAFDFKVIHGEIEAGFIEADFVTENSFRTVPVNQGYLEPFSALAGIDMSGKISIWTQCQGIFAARQMISEFLNLPLNKIRLVPVEIGGAFGGKTYLPLAPLCALLTLKTGRPVRLEMSREEVMIDGRPAPGSLIRVKLGASRSGQLTAADISLAYDAGAYPEMSNAMIASFNVLGQYKIPNVRIESRDVITNKAPSTYYRGPSVPQATLAIESQMDLTARALKIDPLQLRLLNVVEKGDLSAAGREVPRVGFKETLQKMSEYLKKRPAPSGRNQGRGIACGFWTGATGSFSVYIHLNADGTVNLLTGVTDVSGSRTSLAQIAAEELGLPLSGVTVVSGDTDTAPFSNTSTGSQTVYSAGTAVYRACQDLKTQLAKIAAARFGVDEKAVEFAGKTFQVKGDPSKSISLTKLAQSTLAFRGEGPVLGRGSTGGLPASPSLTVHCADIEVDDRTGKVRILNYAVAQDVGLAVNPLSIEGQIQGAVVMGLGWALMEKLVISNGKVQNPNLLDYRIPTAMDAPQVEILLVESPSESGVYGLKHVGEPPMLPVLATLANAIHSATGVRLKTAPFDPETVLKGIKGRGAKESYQPSAISYQLSAFSWREGDQVGEGGLSAVSFQSSVVSFQLSVGERETRREARVK